MSVSLTRRLFALKRVVGTNFVICRAYANQAQAASVPPEGATLLQIIPAFRAFPTAARRE